MAIGKDKTGVLVNMSRETKAKLEELAKKDGRSMTNLINKILLDYIKNKQAVHLDLRILVTSVVSQQIHVCNLFIIEIV